MKTIVSHLVNGMGLVFCRTAPRDFDHRDDEIARFVNSEYRHEGVARRIQMMRDLKNGRTLEDSLEFPRRSTK